MAELAYDITFGIESTTPGTYEVIAGVTSISPPSESVDVLDITTMDSPDATREFMQGLMDPGECSVDLHFKAGGAADTAIRAWRSARATKSCQITFADGYTWTFDGFVTGYTPNLSLGDVQTATLTVKVTSSVVGEAA